MSTMCSQMRVLDVSLVDSKDKTIRSLDVSTDFGKNVGVLLRHTSDFVCAFAALFNAWRIFSRFTMRCLGTLRGSLYRAFGSLGSKQFRQAYTSRYSLRRNLSRALGGCDFAFVYFRLGAQQADKPFSRLFDFSLNIGSALETLRLELEAALLDFATSTRL